MAVSDQNKLREHIAGAQQLLATYIQKLERTYTTTASISSPPPPLSPASHSAPDPPAHTSPPPPLLSPAEYSDVNTTIDDIGVVEGVVELMSECDEELPDLEPKVDTDTMMEISLRNDDDNTVDTSLDYEFEDTPLDYGNTTTFRAVSAKKKDTASLPTRSIQPLNIWGNT